MHTVEMLAEAIALARKLGYQIREDQLEGAGGGHCLIQGRKWLLLDITQSADEQLRDVLDAVRAGGLATEPWQKIREKGDSSGISPELAAEIAGNGQEAGGSREWAA